MKRLSKIVLALGLVLFGLSGLAGCSNPSADEGNKTEDNKPKDAVAVDFTQTNIPASTNTYPAKAETGENPKYINSPQTVSDTTVTGTALKSKDNILTVTPRSDGFFIHVDYNASEESMFWKHTSVRVQNITDEYEVIEASELKIEGTAAAPTSEFLYKFTEKDKKYKVWLAHMGTSKDEWADWGETKDDAVEVTAIGGSGEFNFSAGNIKIELDSNDNRIINLENFVIKKPAALTAPELSIRRIRIEKGSRWDEENGIYKDFWIDTTLSINKDKITIEDEEINNFIKGQTQLYFLLTLKFSYDGYDYNQEFFQNWDNWVSDYVEPLAVPEHQFPLIKIVSTGNGGDNGFIKEPIAHHVKDTAMAWEDPEWLLSIPDPYYEACTIAVGDGEALTGQVKVRGNWTTSYDKKSLRIKFDKKQNLCGLNGGEKYKNWVLLAVWKDASFLRDATALKMFKALFGDDYYASDCQLVEVEVNGEYLGVYLLAEQQETKSGRIEITEAKDNYAGTDIGYLIEFDSYYTSEIENERFEINYGGKLKDYAGREIAAADIQKGYTIKSDVYSAAQKEFIMKYMNRLWRICYEAAYNKKYYKFTDELVLAEYTPEGANADERCRNCISAVIDVKSLANMYIYNELVCDPDLYLTSFFMDIDFAEGKDHKLRFEAPWDFDSTMGNKSFAIADTSNELSKKKNMSTINESFAGTAQTDVNCEHARIHVNPWMVIFAKQAWFQNLVKDQWTAITPTAALNELTTYIDSNSASKYEDVFNYTRYLWGTAAGNDELCEASRTAAKSSQAASATYLKEWLTARFSAVDTIIKNLNTN